MWKYLWLVPGCVAALDLQPRADEKVLEGGFRVSVVSFDHQGQKIRWQPPLGWTLSFKSPVLTLHAKGRTHASMDLRVVPRAAGDREVFGKTETLLPYLARFLPAGASNLAYKGTSEGAFTIGPTPAREFLLAFDEPGHPSMASVSVVEFSAEERLVVVITAKPDDFEEVRQEAVASLFSWQTE
jgi:hypothetical protein